MIYGQRQQIFASLALGVTQVLIATLSHAQGTGEITNSPTLAQTVEPNIDNQQDNATGQSQAASVLQQDTDHISHIHQNTLEMKLVRIPAGEFLMGSHESQEQVAKAFLKEKPEIFRNEHPLRRVTIARSFYIGTTEVTVGQYRQFVDATAYQTQAEKGQMGKAATAVKFEDGVSWRTPLNPKTDADENHPVAVVTYHDAVKFCEWLSQEEGRTYRLPTDAEWEYAARAGTQTRYWNGNSPRKLAEVANIPDVSRSREFAKTFTPSEVGFSHSGGDDGFVSFAPVGSYPANPWGLHDVHGNVWEWCSVADPDSLQIANTEDVAVIRGGCFY